jgi:hypothetical protein|uniref:Uncharacterized protein n=1 Tax=viral metagenome TaxID=1070528 RepID=A0A6C0ISI7_9ZZZZ
MGDNTLMTLFLIFITAGINFGLFFNNKNNIENVTKRLAKLESKVMAIRNNPITTSNEPIPAKPTIAERAELRKKLTKKIMGNNRLKPRKSLVMGALGFR